MCTFMIPLMVIYLLNGRKPRDPDSVFGCEDICCADCFVVISFLDGRQYCIAQHSMLTSSRKSTSQRRQDRRNNTRVKTRFVHTKVYNHQTFFVHLNHLRPITASINKNRLPIKAETAAVEQLKCTNTLSFWNPDLCVISVFLQHEHFAA